MQRGSDKEPRPSSSSYECSMFNSPPPPLVVEAPTGQAHQPCGGLWDEGGMDTRMWGGGGAGPPTIRHGPSADIPFMC